MTAASFTGNTGTSGITGITSATMGTASSLSDGTGSMSSTMTPTTNGGEASDPSVTEATEASSISSDPGATTTTTTTMTTSDTGFEPFCANKLIGTVRDFKIDHPDFEYMNGEDPGIVQLDLGADNKPVYAGQDNNWTTTGQVDFDQWYRDVEGINLTLPLEIQLVNAGGGLFRYDNAAFFPIDDLGWGNEGNNHNFHFTLEIHTQFEYSGGEVFTFRGDDDVFVFINRKLAIDLGGVHNPQELSVNLDQVQGTLGISPGNTYPIDFFFAERHTTASNFRIETTIECLEPPG